MRAKWMFIVPAAVLGIALFTFLGGEIVKLLWNWLMPMLFGLPELTFWQALGLLMLSRILFGGFGVGGSSRSHRRMRRGWRGMTPEERERLRQGFGARCDPGQAPGVASESRAVR